jgi:hypothetical protein
MSGEVIAGVDPRRWAPLRAGAGTDAQDETADPAARLRALAAATCVVAPVLVAVAAPATPRLLAVLAMLTLAPGAALLCLLRPRHAHEPGLVVGLSLGVVVVLAQCMLWTNTWDPEPAFFAVAVGSLLALARPLPRGLPALRLPRVAAARTLAHAGVVASVLGLWALSLSGADLGAMDGLGLLQALPPIWFAAFALLLVGFAVALSGTKLRPGVLALYVIGLVALLHATALLLYDAPRFAWTYKHLGVTELIAATGHAHRALDIYGNWPGFFAASAWLTDVAGVAPIHYAGWSEVFFGLADAAAVAFAVRGVTRDARLVWGTVWIFLIADWVGQTYYAPQALGFVLVMVVIGLCLRCARLPSGHLRPDAPLAPRAAVVAGAVCYLAVVVSHQLSPMMALLAVGALAVVARRVPLRVPIAMLAVEVWWVALAWPFLINTAGLFDTGPATSPRPAGHDLADSPAGFAFVLNASRVLVVILVALAVAGMIRRRRAGWPDRASRALTIAPIAALIAVSYGGESALRVYLFALPWLALLAAAACLPQVRPGSAIRLPGRPSRLAAATLAIGACAVFADFGYELANRVDPAEIRAAAWLEHHAPRGAVAMYLINAVPSHITADYTRLRTRDLTELAAVAPLLHKELGPRDVPAIEKAIRSQWAGPAAVVLSPSQARYARLYGILPPGAQDGLVRALRGSQDFRLLHRDGRTYVFAYRPTWRSRS